jgi:cytochrome P450
VRANPIRFGTLTALDRHADNPDGVLEVRPGRLLVWHPDAINGIFRSDRRMWHGGSSVLGPLLGARSLLWANGDRHAAYRRALAPALRGRGLAARRPVIAETVRAAVDALAPGSLVRLAEWTRTVTLTVIGRMVFGPVDSSLLARFSTAVDAVLGSPLRALAHRFLPIRPTMAGHGLDRALLAMARTAAPHSLVAALTGTLGPLDDSELRDQVWSLLFAGHETTASATAWALYWLDHDHRLRRDVSDELAASGDDGADPARVPLLHAVTQETLRLTPPAPLAGKRVPTVDGELLARPLAAGTVLLPCIYLAHRRAEAFGEPRRFDPGRFLGGQPPTGHYLPFGGGRRRCLGSDLALMEMRMIIAAVLRHRPMRCVNPQAAAPRLRGPAMAPSPRLTVRVGG